MIDPQVGDVHNLNVTTRMLRQFAGLWLAIVGACACWQYLGPSNVKFAIVLAVMAAAIGLPGLAWPEGIRPFFMLLMTVVKPIGWLVSKILLGGLFYLLFTPVALLFRLIGRDALLRRRRPAVVSYWTPKPQVDDVRLYFRQY